MVYSAEYRSPLGVLTLVCDETETALAGLWLEGQKYFLGGLAELPPRGEPPIFQQVRNWLDRYFAGDKPASGELPLSPEGSEFQRAVWAELERIPYGTTATYGGLAAALAKRGRPTSARAVGSAVGRNPISLVIPCHRVVGADGSLTGYAGGVARKEWLLRHEGALCTGHGTGGGKIR